MWFGSWSKAFDSVYDSSSLGYENPWLLEWLCAWEVIPGVLGINPKGWLIYYKAISIRSSTVCTNVCSDVDTMDSTTPLLQGRKGVVGSALIKWNS